MAGFIEQPLTLPRGAARFASDWVSARFWIDHPSGQVTIAADGERWILEPENPVLVDRILDPAHVIVGEFNANLRILLVPGAHEIAGTSFFRLRHP